MRILYVENHAVFAGNVIHQFLSQHSVTVASSLSAARQALEGGDFDLLLVDYDLDDGKGDALVKELHTSSRPMRAIGVSSHDEGNAARTKSSGGVMVGAR
jgi:response regulator of citrate/malate metabolism